MSRRYEARKAEARSRHRARPWLVVVEIREAGVPPRWEWVSYHATETSARGKAQQLNTQEVATMNSWKVEVQADSSRTWSSKALRFAEQQEAEAYGRDLFTRWSAVRAWRAVRSEDVVTHRWDGDRATPLPVLTVIEGDKA